MAVFSYSSEKPDKINLVPFGSEEATYSYNEDSAIYVEDYDYGSITSSIDTDEDYGSISDDYIVGRNFDDFGEIRINQTIVPYGSIFGVDSFGDIKLTKVDVGQVSFTIVGKANIFTTPIEFGSGFIRITGGIDIPTISPSIFGDGTLFGFTGASESTLVNPEDQTILLRFSGTHTVRITANYAGSGSAFAFTGASETISFSNDVYPLFSITGTAIPGITLSHVGSGTLFGFSGSTESTVSNPSENIVLSRIVGEADYQFFVNNTQTTEGSLIVRGTSEVVFAPAYDATGVINILGNVQDSITPAPHIGFGSLFGIVGSSESTTVNPPEEIVLFRFTGQSVERSTDSEVGSGTFEFSDSGASLIFRLGYIGSGKIDIEGNVEESITPAPHIGSGSLFGITGSSESTTVNPVESTALFRIAGSAIEKNTESYVGSVSLDTDGSATTIFGLGHIGSGSLFTFVSATESIAVNPSEDTALFRIAGSAIEKNTESYRGSGSLFTFVSATESSSSVEQSSGLFKISGKARDIFVINNIGSGSLFSFDSATESIAVNPPEDTALFRITGSAIEKNTESYRGSGSLFTFVSATEAVGSNPPESTALFKFTGNLDESFTPAPHVGTGSLFTFVSATEAIAVSPDDTQVLFNIEGQAQERKTKSFVGSGTIFAFTGSAESRTINPPDQTTLFTIAGRATESFTPAPHIGSGSLFTFISSTEIIAVAPPTTPALFHFVGNVVETRTASHMGSGSLFGITGSQDSVAINYAITKVLFAISGRGFEAYSRTNYDGSAEMYFVGASQDRKVEFKRGQIPRIILV